MIRLKAPQRREQLIEVATKLFAKSGYEATTTAAIAEAAGVTEPILYRHFKSKQEMFVAIVREMSDQTMQQWHSIIEDETDPAERIRKICEAIPDHMKRMSDAYHVLHGALATSRDKKVIAVVREHYQQIEEFFGKLVQEGQKAGIFRKGHSARAAAWHFIWAGIGYAMIQLNLGGIDRGLTEDTIEAMLRGLRA